MDNNKQMKLYFMGVWKTTNKWSCITLGVWKITNKWSSIPHGVWKITNKWSCFPWVYGK
jgi:hypothetical protein